MMFQFFESIGGFLTSLVDYLINFFGMLLVLVRSMVQGVEWLFMMIALLPPFLTMFVLVPVSLAVFYQLLNKGS